MIGNAKLCKPQGLLAIKTNGTAHVCYGPASAEPDGCRHHPQPAHGRRTGQRVSTTAGAKEIKGYIRAAVLPNQAGVVGLCRGYLGRRSRLAMRSPWTGISRTPRKAAALTRSRPRSCMAALEQADPQYNVNRFGPGRRPRAADRRRGEGGGARPSTSPCWRTPRWSRSPAPSRQTEDGGVTPARRLPIPHRPAYGDGADIPAADGKDPRSTPCLPAAPSAAALLRTADYQVEAGAGLCPDRPLAPGETGLVARG